MGHLSSGEAHRMGTGLQGEGERGQGSTWLPKQFCLSLLELYFTENQLQADLAGTTEPKESFTGISIAQQQTSSTTIQTR